MYRIRCIAFYTTYILTFVSLSIHLFQYNAQVHIFLKKYHPAVTTAVSLLYFAIIHKLNPTSYASLRTAALPGFRLHLQHGPGVLIPTAGWCNRVNWYNFSNTKLIPLTPIPTLNLEQQFTAFEKKRTADVNIKPHHVSLYYCLLAKWLRHKHNPVIRISARELMPLSKIGSRNAYTRYIQDLKNWGYISNCRRDLNGTLIEMAILYICIDNDTNQSYLLENIDKEKEIEIDKHSNVPSLKEVKAMYTEYGLTPADAIHFYDFYEKKNWKTKNGTPILYWKALAQKAINTLLQTKPPSNDKPGKSKYQDPI